MSRVPALSKSFAIALVLLSAPLIGSAALADGSTPPRAPSEHLSGSATGERPSVDESATGANPRLRVRAPIAAGGPAGAPVMTRALVRHRIETIDPTEWLARYGKVERHDLD